MSAVAFLVSTIVCIFAPNIGVLVAFRALQGAAGAWLGKGGGAVCVCIFAPNIGVLVVFSAMQEAAGACVA